MLFTSYEYLLVFLPVVWLHYLTLRFTVLRPVLLTISGYVFYAWGRPWISVLLFLSSTVDFFIGPYLDRAYARANRSALLVASLLFNIGLLIIFKYGTWILNGVNAALTELHFQRQIPVPEIIPPPDISFYTRGNGFFLCRHFHHPSEFVRRERLDAFGVLLPEMVAQFVS